jgi:hypothetical protein
MTYYIVMRVTHWDAFEPTIALPILGGVRGPEGSVGFLPVFDTLEAAREWGGPDAQISVAQPSASGEVAAR